jgi:hypothetical protein
MATGVLWLAHLTARQGNTSLHLADTAQHGCYLQAFLQFCRVGHLEGQGIAYSVYLVLGTAAPARVVAPRIFLAHLSTVVLCCEAIYGGRLRLWNSRAHMRVTTCSVYFFNCVPM